MQLVTLNALIRILKPKKNPISTIKTMKIFRPTIDNKNVAPLKRARFPEKYSS